MRGKMRFTLSLVGIQQPVGRLPLENRREFPRQVLRIPDPAAHSLPQERWCLVGGVAASITRSERHVRETREWNVYRVERMTSKLGWIDIATQHLIDDFGRLEGLGVLVLVQHELPTPVCAAAWNVGRRTVRITVLSEEWRQNGVLSRFASTTTHRSSYPTSSISAPISNERRYARRRTQARSGRSSWQRLCRQADVDPHELIRLRISQQRRATSHLDVAVARNSPVENLLQLRLKEIVAVLPPVRRRTVLPPAE